ncbi:hypothetical protein N7537_007929 [Penicillium hordei]|uniref:Uncharacterized protein n=1 Tax=Penicillium hordei TaxID=40994 RepID=A0AAD6GXZ8_9EURO|nr:uncharacterized protein N7537_007929 [Penicillium hordei]KAJ5597845.1 hypothetical protein N7537_007929 [Penicillium hordei]
MYTYGWRTGQYDPHAHNKVEHSCVDWEWFEDWLDERKFSEHDKQGLIKRPDGTTWDPHRFH